VDPKNLPSHLGDLCVCVQFLQRFWKCLVSRTWACREYVLVYTSGHTGNFYLGYHLLNNRVCTEDIFKVKQAAGNAITRRF
jgi:hypothetical protein